MKGIFDENQKTGFRHASEDVFSRNIDFEILELTCEVLWEFGFKRTGIATLLL